MTVNKTWHIFNLVSRGTECISTSALVCLVGMSRGTRSSARGLENCARTAGIKSIIH